MNAMALLVRHRSVDLVAMTALHALRSSMGATGLIDLRRDDVFAWEGPDLGAPGAWIERATAQANWFNPNKHRFALFETAPGALEAARTDKPFPTPWLGDLVASDHPALETGRYGIADWLGPPEEGFAVTLLAWDREMGEGSLPGRRWPAAQTRVLRAQMWTLTVREASEKVAFETAEKLAITRTRDSGLLVHPHMEGWCFLPTGATE